MRQRITVDEIERIRKDLNKLYDKIDSRAYFGSDEERQAIKDLQKVLLKFDSQYIIRITTKINLARNKLYKTKQGVLPSMVLKPLQISKSHIVELIELLDFLDRQIGKIDGKYYELTSKFENYLQTKNQRLIKNGVEKFT